MRSRIVVGRMRRDRGISVARPTALGNPFVVGRPWSREASIARYREHFAKLIADQDAPAMEQLLRIEAAARTGDVTLLCWCAPSACHAEVVADYVERKLLRE